MWKDLAGGGAGAWIFDVMLMIVTMKCNEQDMKR